MTATYLVLILGLSIGLGVGLALARRGKNTALPAQKGEIPKSTERRIEEKEKNKRKTLELFEAKNEITNNDVERALGVSNATAERYLQELEEEGSIGQFGKTGRSVLYRKV